MMKKMIGIELSDQWIKIVELREKRRHWDVKAAVKIEAPQGAIVDGEVVAQDTLYTLIKEQLMRLGIKSKRVCVRITSKQVLTKYMPLQARSVKEAKKLVSDKKQLYFPVEGDYVIDAAITGEKRGQELGALMVAAPNRVIHSVVGLVEHLGLRAVSISIPSYGYCKQFDQETAIVLDIGGNMSTLTYVAQGTCKAVQQVGFGMCDVEQALTCEFGAAESEEFTRFFERYMRLFPEADPNDKEFVSHYVSAVVASAMEQQLINELQKMMLFSAGELGAQEVEKLYVTGDCGEIKGIIQYLEAQLGVPTAFLMPEVSIEDQSMRRFKRDLPAFANILCLTVASASA